MKRPLGVLALILLLTGTAQAWKPSGWVWQTWPYAYDHDTGAWYWFDADDTQWAYGFPPANGWTPLATSTLGTGWSWWQWPYTYDWELGAWYYLNERDTQWCVNLGSGQWSLFSEDVAPAGMVWIPGGTNSGTNPYDPNEYRGGPDCYVDDYTLTVDSVFMDRREVTGALWNDVLGWALTNGYDFSNLGLAKEPDHPVHSINWFDAVKWCNARSEREQRPPCYRVTGAIYRAGTQDMTAVACDFNVPGYRLPTTTEWEYAARGGIPNHRFPWSDSDDIQHTRANYFSTNFAAMYSTNSISYDTSPTRGCHPDYRTGAEPYTSPAGSFAPNGFGLYDVAGNVNEWAWGRAPTLWNLVLANYRGGSWRHTAFFCRVSMCNGMSPWEQSIYTGFRTVLTPEAKDATR